MALVLKDRGRAEEVVEEAFARALARWSRVSHMERPAAWVYVVAVNAEKRRLARDRTDAAADLASVAVSGGQDATAERLDLGAAVASLPSRQRATVVLRYLADLSNQQVADALGCSVGTVKSALHTALAKLRIELEDADADA